MGKQSFLLAVLFFSLAAQAQKSDSPMRINTTDPLYASPEMQKHAKVTVDLSPPAWGISQKDRDSILEKSGLMENIKAAGMDEVDKDVFFDLLRTKTFSDLKQKYPSLPKEKMEKAKKLLAEAAKANP